MPPDAVISSTRLFSCNQSSRDALVGTYVSVELRNAYKT